MSKSFIFGYGSLINKKSILKTSDFGNIYPVKVYGYKREWNLIAYDFKLTALGLIKDKNYYCNGVLLEIEEKDLKKFDEREIGYKREQINIQNIEFYDNNINDCYINIWVYIPEKSMLKYPSREYPIVQSYLDVIIDGCLDFGEKFTFDFFKTTFYFKNLLFDRKKPRYIRNLGKNYNYDKIDRIIKIATENNLFK